MSTIYVRGLRALLKHSSHPWLGMAMVVALILSAQAATTNEPLAQSPQLSVATLATNALAEHEYARLMAQEDAAQKEIRQWQTEKISPEDFEKREHERLEPVRKAYDAFVRRYPNHLRSRLDYGAFLNELHDRAGARAQWEKALELDPQNADAYNFLAGVYSATGPAEKSFEFYDKAIQLDPSSAAYYHNYADTIYVLRKAAARVYRIDEQQVYTRALSLYSNAVRLEPQNYNYGWDFAQTYYAIEPLPVDLALQSWTNTLKSAGDEVERQGVYVHLARVNMLAGNFSEARAHLEAVTNPRHAESKARLLRNIDEREKGPGATNSTPKPRIAR